MKPPFKKIIDYFFEEICDLSILTNINLFCIIFISAYIIAMGISFPNKAKAIKYLNIILAFYIMGILLMTINEFVIRDITILALKDTYLNNFFFILVLQIRNI